MSERKVLNKYYPPDFDPSKIPRRKRPLDEQYKVRLMAPFSMRCNTCGEWIAKGKKFNARKENSVGESYLGIQIFRFYIRCPRCSAEITFKTDPKNSDYVCEQGASRNVEPWRDEADAVEEEKREREQEEQNNPMQHLENRTRDTKREIDILDALDEMRSIRAQQERLGVDTALIQQTTEAIAEQEAEEEEDERLIRELFGARSTGDGPGGADEVEDEVVEEINLFDLVAAPAQQPTAVVSSVASSSALKAPTPASATSSSLPSSSSAAGKPEESKKRKLGGSSNPLGIVVKKKTA